MMEGDTSEYVEEAKTPREESKRPEDTEEVVSKLRVESTD